MLTLLILGIFLCAALVILFVITSAFIGFYISHVPFVPTPKRDIQLTVDIARITKSDTVYELGSGNGRVAFGIERLAAARVIAFELTLWTHLYARIKKYFLHSKVKLELGNFFDSSWSDATVIYCYLYPMLMARIGEKAKAECRPGTRIVSRDFKIPNLPQTDYRKIDKIHELFVYTV